MSGAGESGAGSSEECGISVKSNLRRKSGAMGAHVTSGKGRRVVDDDAEGVSLRLNNVTR